MHIWQDNRMLVNVMQQGMPAWIRICTNAVVKWEVFTSDKIEEATAIEAINYLWEMQAARCHVQLIAIFKFRLGMVAWIVTGKCIVYTAGTEDRRQWPQKWHSNIAAQELEHTNNALSLTSFCYFSKAMTCALWLLVESTLPWYTTTVLQHEL